MRTQRVALRCILFLFAASAFALTGCGGGSSDGTSQQITDIQFQWFDPSGGGQLQILANGGEGLDGNGGDGGEFQIYAYSSGDIRVLDYGRVVTDFVVPNVRPELGENPRTIAADTTITPDPSTYHILGDDGVNEATGLWVLADVTLTLNANDPGGSTARINFDDGVLVEGTIRTAQRELVELKAVLGGETIGLSLNAENIVVGPTGVIDTRGQDQPGADAGRGGDVDFSCDSAIVNNGRVMTYGGSGSRGGDGGDVYFYTDWFGIYNTGPISSYGGTGTTRHGGNGGYIDFEAYDSGPIVNHGTLLSYGGNGTPGPESGAPGGGDGGYVEFYVDYKGAVINSADINANGGNAVGEGDGGDAGYFYIRACSSIRMAGSVQARGGNGAGGGRGGDGDYFEIYLQDNDYVEGNYAVGGMFVGANIDVRGGNGTSGGDGGDVYFYPDQDEAYIPGQQVTILAGYAAMNFSGGNGTENGGNADDQEVYNDGAQLNYSGDDYWVGSIIWDGPSFDNSGGNGTYGYAGDGGNFEIYLYDYTSTPDYMRVVSVTGNFDLSGGNAATYGGDAGYWYQYDNLHTMFNGTLDARGGNGGSMPSVEDSPWIGGDGGSVEIFSDDIVEVAGTIDNAGGNAVLGHAGDADDIEIAGRSGSCDANINCAGGSTSDGMGGDAGYVYLYCTDTLMDVTGSMMAAGGAGTEPGYDGACYVNGIQADLNGGLVTLP